MISRSLWIILSTLIFTSCTEKKTESAPIHSPHHLTETPQMPDKDKNVAILLDSAPKESIKSTAALPPHQKNGKRLVYAGVLDQERYALDIDFISDKKADLRFCDEHSKSKLKCDYRRVQWKKFPKVQMEFLCAEDSADAHTGRKLRFVMLKNRVWLAVVYKEGEFIDFPKQMPHHPTPYSFISLSEGGKFQRLQTGFGTWNDDIENYGFIEKCRQ